MFGPGLGSTPQPGGLLRRRRLRRHAVAGCRRLPARPGGGCIGGAVVANLMFGRAAVSHLDQASAIGRPLPLRGRRHPRAAPGDLRPGPVRSGRHAAPAAVGAYIGAAYFFTSSTSFANPAITIGRMFSEHLRRHRAGFGPGLHRRPGRRRPRGGARDPRPLPGSRRLPTRRTSFYRTTKNGAIREQQVPEVLFVCVHNAGRSQMAAALLDHHAQGRVRVRSAGSPPPTSSTRPSSKPCTRWRLDSPGTSQAPHRRACPGSRRRRHDGLRRHVPGLPGQADVDWELDDPAGQPVDEVRPIVDEIDRRVRSLLHELTPDKGTEW